MRLTNDDRDAFVRAVMDDVPQVDYDDQTSKIVLEESVRLLPAVVRKVWEKSETRGFIKTVWQSMPTPLSSLYVPIKVENVTSDAWVRLTGLAKRKMEQETARAKLKQSVRSVILGCSTLKQAKERLPEFVKYLPADRDGSSTAGLPVVSNVVADLTKAGWPKK